jgi:hypothetical protein
VSHPPSAVWPGESGMYSHTPLALFSLASIGVDPVAASTTLTSQFALSATAADIYNQYTSVALSGFHVSLQAPAGGFAALPCSTAGDR